MKKVLICLLVYVSLVFCNTAFCANATSTPSVAAVEVVLDETTPAWVSERDALKASLSAQTVAAEMKLSKLRAIPLHENDTVAPLTALKEAESLARTLRKATHKLDRATTDNWVSMKASAEKTAARLSESLTTAERVIKSAAL